jgi:hypothetical protein
MKFKTVVWVLLLTPAIALGQAGNAGLGGNRPRSSYDPGAAGGANGQQQSGVSAALQKINPQNKDYGAVIEHGRIAVFEQTTEDFYWWSCMILTMLLMLSTMYTVWLWRERDFRLSISGDIVAQLYNSHIAARAKAIETIDKHNQLVRRYNAQSVDLAAMREVNTQKETSAGSKDGIEAADKLRSKRAKHASEAAVVDSSASPIDSAPAQVEVLELAAEDVASEDVSQLQELVRQLTAQNKAQNKASEQKIANLRTQLGRAHHSLEDLRGNAPTGRQA